MQHGERFVTGVLEAVASRMHNDMHEQHPEQVESWDEVSMPRRQAIKSGLLPLVLHTLDAAKEVRGPVQVATSWPLQDDEVAEHLVSASFDSDGRSEWRWLTTADGDLMLGIHPQGATFEMLSQGPASDDFDAALEADRVSNHTIDLED